MSDISELSGPEEEEIKKRKESKGLILKKDKKEKKQKEKETRYAHLGEDSTGEDEVEGKSPAKSKLSKPFMFGSGRKDKDKKKDFETVTSSGGSSGTGNAGAVLAGGASMSSSAALAGHQAGFASKDKKKEKEKEKKDLKPKLKLKKSKTVENDSDNGKSKSAWFSDPVDECPIFGVPLEVAVERNRCHDGIPLPMVVRQCIDYIEEHGLMMEGVYRSSGVKSKVNKLRAAFNSRETDQIGLNDYEPAVVASVLKQFLRELPDPVLTNHLMLKFEEVSALTHPQKRIEGMRALLAELPECNRTLLSWIFVHMKHVIERERFNKMTLQNVSIVLSPTMRISHRVLNCLFENSHILFDGVQLKKYVPPITTSSDSQGGSLALPESPDAIEEEIKKQESLLADLHLQISSGAASKKTEEQIWEQQRIVTQLKRKLRTAKKESVQPEKAPQPRYEPIEYDEELDFSLQVAPSLQSLSLEQQASPGKPTPEQLEQHQQQLQQNQMQLQQQQKVQQQQQQLQQVQQKHQLQQVQQQQQILQQQQQKMQQQQQQEGSSGASTGQDTPEDKEPQDTEHKVTVMVHRSDLQQRKQVEQLPLQQKQPQQQQQKQLPPQQQQQQQQPELSQIRKPAEPLPQQQAPSAVHVVPRPQPVQLQPDQPANPVIQPLNEQQQPRKESTDQTDGGKDKDPPQRRKSSHVTVIRLGSSQEGQAEISSTEKPSKNTENKMSTIDQKCVTVVSTFQDSVFKIPAPATTTPSTMSGIPLLPPPPGPTKSRNAGHSMQILRPVPASPMHKTTAFNVSSPSQTVATSNHLNRIAQHPVTTSLFVDSSSAFAKSRSLPRGLPSDGSAFNAFEHATSNVASNVASMSNYRPFLSTGPQSLNPNINDPRRQQAPLPVRAPETSDMSIVDLHWETLRLQFEYEELMALKSELERRKRSERNEMEDLREEIATMQTLYQYRTYSVDSSESSSDENSDKDVREEVEELSKTLSDLVRENKELEEKRLELCHKIEEERSSCVDLRVQIRIEQERLQKKRLARLS